jgi:hypothetical protein
MIFMTTLAQPVHLGRFIAITFILGTLVFGFGLDNYSFVSQTLSEIGSMSSPFRIQFQIFKILIATLLLFFSVFILRYSKRNKVSMIPGILLLCFGMSDLGISLFPTPHSLHNIFGLSMTVGYLSPLFFGLLWPDTVSRNFKRTSLAFFLIILIGIVLNLSPAFKPDLYPMTYYGLVQRFLVFTMFIYLAYLGGAIQNKD